jgi:hypothetical protein
MADEKLCCDRSTRPKAVLAVGLRQKALPQRFLITTTASKVFQRPAEIRVNPPALRSLAKEGAIRGENQRLLATISVD